MSRKPGLGRRGKTRKKEPQKDLRREPEKAPLPDNVLDLQDRSVWQAGSARSAERLVSAHAKTRKRRAERPQRTRRLVTLLIVLAIAASIAAAVYFIRVDEIVIEGNEFYTDEEIEHMIFTERTDRMSLILWFKDHFRDHVEIPFVSSYDISFSGPSSVHVIVYERSIIGCLDYLGTYMYFDNDGTVVESTTVRDRDAVMVTGLDFSQIVLYRQLPVDDDSIFGDILRVSQLLEVYGIRADMMRIDDHERLTLQLQDILDEQGNVVHALNGVTVFLGDGVYIEEKMSELADMIPSLDGQQGTLYLDAFDPNAAGHGYVMVTDGGAGQAAAAQETPAAAETPAEGEAAPEDGAAQEGEATPDGEAAPEEEPAPAEEPAPEPEPEPQVEEPDPQPEEAPEQQPEEAPE